MVKYRQPLFCFSRSNCFSTMTAFYTVKSSILCGWFSCAVIVGLHADPNTTGPLLELPKMTVTEMRNLPAPEAWRYAQVPGLEILSAASDRETQKLLRDFRLFNDAITVVWPALKAHRSVPMSLILCGTGQKFDAFVPLSPDKSQVSRASLLLHNSE